MIYAKGGEFILKKGEVKFLESNIVTNYTPCPWIESKMKPKEIIIIEIDKGKE